MMTSESTNIESLHHSLIQFYDELEEFIDCYAFLSDAVSSLMSEECDVDADTMLGAKRYLMSLKSQSECLKQTLGQMLNTSESLLLKDKPNSAIKPVE